LDSAIISESVVNWGLMAELTRLVALCLDVLAEALEELQLTQGLD